MKILSNLRSIVEGWLIDDTLNSNNFTNLNQESNEFIDKFGLGQLCLLEMFDEHTRCFYGSDVAGFSFLLVSRPEHGQFSELQYRLLTDMPHQIPRGFGVQITSLRGELVVSVSCNAAFTDAVSVDAMLAVQKGLFGYLSEGFFVDYVDADKLINIAARILYPNRFLGRSAPLVYRDAFFVRDQIVDVESIKIQVLRDQLQYQTANEQYKIVGFGVRRYFDAQNLQPSMTDYQRFIDDHVISLNDAIFTLGFYNPIEMKKPKGLSTYEHQNRQKLQVYHVILCAEHKSDELMYLMHVLDYQIERLHNRQLAALFFSMPISFGASMAQDVYDLRLSKSVNLLHNHDFFPIILNFSAGNNEKV